jgi:hypothetical protein
VVYAVTGWSAEVLFVVRDEYVIVFRTVFQESTIVGSFAEDGIGFDHLIAA